MDHLPPTSLQNSYLTLFKFLMRTKRRAVELGSEYDLTGMQTIVLFLLDQPRPMNAFKKVFNCDASNVTGIVDGLENKELVSRFEDPRDRRIKMVRLEPEGVRVRCAIMHSLTTDEFSLLNRLTSEEREVFISLLEKITDDQTP
jgi:DNA-binding MarR family transcriptional regulator